MSSSMVSAGVVSGNTFVSIQAEINDPGNGGVVDLGSDTYLGSDHINVTNGMGLVIQGSDPSNRATLDADFNSYVFKVNSTSTVTFRNINFVNGDSSIDPGGAIIAHSTVIIENCTFSDNSGQSGGAIMMNPGAAGSRISFCEFIHNQGLYEHHAWGWGEGAAVDVHANNVIIEYCNFTNNYAVNNGGALSFAVGTGGQVKNSIFQDNKADNNAGAILIRNSEATIEDCTFNNNQAIYGSAIFNNENSTANINNCIFNGNLAKTIDIVAPEYIVNRPTDAILEISLVLGDNIEDAIYNDQGNITIDAAIPVMSDSSPNQNITIAINGTNYTNTTNSTGVATFNIPTSSLELKDYSYTATYTQTTLYTGISKNSKITITENNSNPGAVPGTEQHQTNAQQQKNHKQ